MQIYLFLKIRKEIWDVVWRRVVRRRSVVRVGVRGWVRVDVGGMIFGLLLFLGIGIIIMRGYYCVGVLGFGYYYFRLL